MKSSTNISFAFKILILQRLLIWALRNSHSWSEIPSLESHDQQSLFMNIPANQSQRIKITSYNPNLQSLSTCSSDSISLKSTTLSQHSTLLETWSFRWTTLCRPSRPAAASTSPSSSGSPSASAASLWRAETWRRPCAQTTLRRTYPPSSWSTSPRIQPSVNFWAMWEAPWWSKASRSSWTGSCRTSDTSRGATSTRSIRTRSPSPEARGTPQMTTAGPLSEGLWAGGSSWGPRQRW